MKDTFVTVQGQPCILKGPDLTDQQIVVNGRIWRFDYDKMFGPLWLRKDGTERTCQYPNKAVWKEFEKWQKKHGLRPNN